MFGLLSLLLLPLSAIATPGYPGYGTAPAKSPCSDILIITTRGSNELQPNVTAQNTAFDGGEIVDVHASVGFGGISGEGELGVVAQKVQHIVEKYTNLKVKREAVVYPALDRDSTGALSATVYGTSVIGGITNLTKQIVIQATTCPKQKIVLLGYSQGANIVGDTLAGGGGCYGIAPNCTNLFVLESELGLKALNASYAHLISAVVLWGDPRHNETSQKAFVTGFPPPKLGGLFPRPPDSEAVLVENYCKTFKVPHTHFKETICKIKSICDAQDFFCGSGVNAAGSVNATESYLIHDTFYLKPAPVAASVTFALEGLGYSELSDRL